MKRLLSTLLFLTLTCLLCVAQEAGNVRLDVKGTTLQVTFFSPEIVHVVRYPSSSTGPSRKSMVVTLQPDAALAVQKSETPSRMQLSSSSLTVNIDKRSGLLQFLSKGRNLLKEKEFGMPDYEDALGQYAALRKAIEAGLVKSTYAIGFGGIIEAVSKMAFGNKLGVKLTSTADLAACCGVGLADKHYGWIVAEVANAGNLPFRCTQIGEVTAESVFEVAGEKISLEEALAAWQKTLEGVFPTRSTASAGTIKPVEPVGFKDIYVCKHKVAKPHVFIPAFPGTNCEYDSARAFNRAGAESEIIVFRNQNGQQIRESVDAYVDAIRRSQIVMIPGGFSAGDEPEGSAKFITSVFRNQRIADAVMELLSKRDGLMLGICNGFQALVKLGLVPYGEIRPQAVDAPTLTFNTIGRHQSKMAYTRVTSNLSPWLRKAELGATYVIPISHGEGRFVAPQEWIDRLFKNGQVATQYVDLQGNPTMDEEYNMNGSFMAIEGITSPDGRVFGKMGHSERRSKGSALNIYGNDDQQIFESGVQYFK